MWLLVTNKILAKQSSINIHWKTELAKKIRRVWGMAAQTRHILTGGFTALKRTA